VIWTYSYKLLRNTGEVYKLLADIFTREKKNIKHGGAHMEGRIVANLPAAIFECVES